MTGVLRTYAYRIRLLRPVKASMQDSKICRFGLQESDIAFGMREDNGSIPAKVHCLCQGMSSCGCSFRLPFEAKSNSINQNKMHQETWDYDCTALGRFVSFMQFLGTRMRNIKGEVSRKHVRSILNHGLLVLRIPISEDSASLLSPHNYINCAKYTPK